MGHYVADYSNRFTILISEHSRFVYQNKVYSLLINLEI